MSTALARIENEKVALLLLAVFYTVFLILQDSIVDTADGILHYQYARFATEHPENFFNHWAKPVFTFLAFLPAQAGLFGIKVLNIIMVMATAWFVMKTARALEIREWFLAGFIAVLGNSVTYVVLGGLTEPSMMLTLSAVMYAAAVGHFKLMYALLGLSLMVRPEAIVMVAFFGLFGLIKKKWKAIPYALIFPVVISISGMLVAGLEWSWIVTNQPYNPGGSVYGGGDWMHYYNRWGKVAPYITLYLALVGFILIPLRKNWNSLIPIALTGFGILVLHAFLWRFGKMGSAGLARTLTTALPALGILASLALSQLPKRAFVSVVGLLFLIEFAGKHEFPKEIDRGEKAARLMAESIHERGLKQGDNRIAYQFATTAFFLDLNPFDNKSAVKLWSLDRERATNSLKTGDVLIWDNVTGHREGALPWVQISNDLHAQQIDSIHVEGIKIVSFRIVK